jgi:hypothetical protein
MNTESTPTGAGSLPNVHLNRWIVPFGFCSHRIANYWLQDSEAEAEGEFKVAAE